MQIDEATYNKMPERLQRLFAKLPNPGSAEVLAGFPVTTSGTLKHVNTSIGGNGVFGGGTSGERNHTGDTGSAARFFYCAKASKADRDEGCEGLELREASVNDNRPSGNMSQRLHQEEERGDIFRRNHHPTVKPTALMRYLVRLVTPPGGIVFDPFMGSGSTGKAAMLEGFNFIGCEIEQEYITIAEKRIKHAADQFMAEHEKIETYQEAFA